MDYLTPYLPLVITIAIAGSLGFGLLAFAALFGPKTSGVVKTAPFECGSNPIGNARQPFAVKFYVVGLLFIVFDLEVVFFYPFAVVLKELSWPGYVSLLSFAVTLAIGLIYVWRKGALDWES